MYLSKTNKWQKHVFVENVALYFSFEEFLTEFYWIVKRNTAICCKQVQINQINMYQLYIISNNLKFTYQFNVPNIKHFKQWRIIRTHAIYFLIEECC